jgi:hypothetical protein
MKATTSAVMPTAAARRRGAARDRTFMTLTSLAEEIRRNSLPGAMPSADIPPHVLPHKTSRYYNNGSTSRDGVRPGISDDRTARLVSKPTA